MIEWATDVTVSDAVTLYIIDLVPGHAIGSGSLQMGASARASLALMRAVARAGGVAGP